MSDIQVYSSSGMNWTWYLAVEGDRILGHWRMHDFDDRGYPKFKIEPCGEFVLIESTDNKRIVEAMELRPRGRDKIVLQVSNPQQIFSYGGINAYFSGSSMEKVEEVFDLENWTSPDVYR